jgi:hypothetical protein
MTVWAETSNPVKIGERSGPPGLTLERLAHRLTVSVSPMKPSTIWAKYGICADLSGRLRAGASVHHFSACQWPTDISVVTPAGPVFQTENRALTKTMIIWVQNLILINLGFFES